MTGSSSGTMDAPDPGGSAQLVPRSEGVSGPDMSNWIDVGSGHRVQIVENGGVIWEHDTTPEYQTSGYFVSRHLVSPSEGASWVVKQAEPLTLSPSLHCDPALGGCGVHGFVFNGKWVGV